MSRLTRDGTAEPVSRDQILRHERGQGNINFSCSADHVQDWQPYPVDPDSCYMCDHTMSSCREGPTSSCAHEPPIAKWRHKQTQANIHQGAEGFGGKALTEGSLSK